MDGPAETSIVATGAADDGWTTDSATDGWADGQTGEDKKGGQRRRGQREEGRNEEGTGRGRVEMKKRIDFGFSLSLIVYTHTMKKGIDFGFFSLFHNEAMRRFLLPCSIIL